MKRSKNEFIEQKHNMILRITSDVYGTKDFIIDKEDYLKIKNFRWSLKVNSNKTLRVANFKRGNLTRFILGINKNPKTCLVGFKDGNYYNYQKNNLKLITRNEHSRKVLQKLIKRNEYVFKEDIAIIKIKSPKHGYFETTIDIEDYEKVKNFTWHIAKRYKQDVFYVSSGQRNDGKEKSIPLHNLIMDCPKDKVIDHIDRNPLNNRRKNLRICTTIINSQNRNPNYNSKSGYVGVRYNKYKKKWTAYIKVNGINHSKNVLTKEEAIEQRRQWELEFWGEEALKINDENRKRTAES